MEKQRVTINDVAERAGVSKTTVSQALSGKGQVAEQTKRKVLEAVAETGYQPNHYAQALALNGSRPDAFTRIWNLAGEFPVAQSIGKEDTVSTAQGEVNFYRRVQVPSPTSTEMAPYDILLNFNSSSAWRIQGSFSRVKSCVVDREGLRSLSFQVATGRTNRVENFDLIGLPFPDRERLAVIRREWAEGLADFLGA